MNLKALERSYAGILLFIFLLIVVHAPLVVWLGTIFPSASDVLKAWKELLMLPAALIAVVLVSKHGLWREFSRDWLFRLIIAYAALHILLLAVFWNGASATMAGLAIDFRFVLYFSLVYVLVRLQPIYKTRLLIVGACGALVVGLFALLQTTVLPADILTHIGYGSNTIEPYLTVDKNPDYVRINSSLRGPNPLGLYAGIVLTVVLATFLRARTQLARWKYTSAVIAIGAVVGVYASYSRSALLAAVVSLAIIAGSVYGKRLSSKLKLAAVIGVIVVFVGGLAVAQTDFGANVILHDDPDTGALVTSNNAHLQSLEHGLARFVRQPLGNGIGSSGSASLYSDQPQIIENQYLLIAHETGWLGLGLFLGIFGVLLRRLWHQRDNWLALAVLASGVGIGLAGLLLPVWADDTVAIIWWGLAAAALGGNYAKQSRQ